MTAARDRYVNDLIEAGSSIAMPELCNRPQALYSVAERGGLGVVAMRELDLDARQHDDLARFRFAQYLAAGFIDKDIAFRERLDQSPHSGYASADTVHFIAFEAATGELLASMCQIGAPPADPGLRVASRDRPLFPVEEQFGWGSFHRLALAPDTPIERVRDFGRLVKNGRHAGAGTRAVIELVLAALRLGVGGKLASTFDLCIGQIEPTRVQRNLEFFHIPLVVVRSGLPAFGPDHPLNPGLEGRERYPFAFWVPDLEQIVPRMDTIEEALALPDAQAIRALVALKQVPPTSRCSLVPPGGIPALADTPLPQRSMPTQQRRHAREQGRELRRFPALAGLSDTERIALRTFAVEALVAPGTTLLGRGEIARELVLIEDGIAQRGRGALGPGACVGTAGVLRGAPSPAAVVASTAMRTLRLGGEIYERFLRELPEVELELQRLATDELRPSRPNLIATGTAETQAALRAAGAAARDPQLRNPDFMAAGFVTPRLRLQTLAKVPGVRQVVPALAERLAPGSYHYETARVKHMDGILEAEQRAGLDQLVILGAGYDSRAYRFADALRDVRVFEVDLPAMSAIKQGKVARLYPATPRHVTYVAADLLGPDLEAALQQHGYDVDGATLLILSGVMPYLHELAVARLFAFVGRHTSPRTSLAFDYIFREMIEGDDTGHGARQVRKRLAGLGEPLRFGIPAGGASRFVDSFGLTLVSDVQPAELAHRYLRRTDGSPAGLPYGFSAIAHARASAHVSSSRWRCDGWTMSA
jgi:methyltransferase (TIGR00027 family)